MFKDLHKDDVDDEGESTRKNENKQEGFIKY